MEADEEDNWTQLGTIAIEMVSRYGAETPALPQAGSVIFQMKPRLVYSGVPERSGRAFCACVQLYAPPRKAVAHD